MIILNPRVKARTHVSADDKGPVRDYYFEVVDSGFCVIVHYDGRKAQRAQAHTFSNVLPQTGVKVTTKVPRECITRATNALQDVWK